MEQGAESGSEQGGSRSTNTKKHSRHHSENGDASKPKKKKEHRQKTHSREEGDAPTSSEGKGGKKDHRHRHHHQSSKENGASSSSSKEKHVHRSKHSSHHHHQHGEHAGSKETTVACIDDHDDEEREEEAAKKNKKASSSKSKGNKDGKDGAKGSSAGRAASDDAAPGSAVAPGKKHAAVPAKTSPGEEDPAPHASKKSGGASGERNREAHQASGGLAKTGQADASPPQVKDPPATAKKSSKCKGGDEDTRTGNKHKEPGSANAAEGSGSSSKKGGLGAAKKIEPKRALEPIALCAEREESAGVKKKLPRAMPAAAPAAADSNDDDDDVCSHSDGGGEDDGCEEGFLGADLSDGSDEPGETSPVEKPASQSARSGSKRKRSTPKKHGSVMSKEAAMGMLASLHIPAPRMKDYVCAKVFNAFSCGMYFKFLAQCRAADEAWAFDVQSSISNVQKLSGMLSCVVSTLKQAEEAHAPSPQADHSFAYATPRLSHAVACTMSNTSPPVRRRVEQIKAAMSKGSGEQEQQQQQLKCCVTGSVLEGECLELKPAGKAQGGAVAVPAALVRTDFEHFFSMLWFCYKIEHVIRQFAKCWMDDVMEKGQACMPDEKRCSDDGDDHVLDDSTAPGAEVAAGSCKEGEGDTGDSASAAAAVTAGGGGGGGSCGAEGDEKRGASLGVIAFEQCKDGHPDEPGALNMQALCEKFSKDCDDTISCMHKTFMHGYSHVIESIYAHQPVARFLDESGLSAKKRPGGSGKSADERRAEGGGCGEPARKKAKKRGTDGSSSHPSKGNASGKATNDGAKKKKAVGGVPVPAISSSGSGAGKKKIHKKKGTGESKSCRMDSESGGDECVGGNDSHDDDDDDDDDCDMDS